MKDIDQVRVQENIMIKAMTFPSTARRHHVFAWVSIFWFSITVCEGVELQTESQVAARCGENVTLTCDAILSNQTQIKLLSWVAWNRTVCQYGSDQADHEFQCESTNESSSRRLTLKLINIMPVNEGQYLCKARSNKGTKSNTTVLTVGECRGRSGSSLNDLYAKCWFDGVYPRGVVHWFQEETNLTDSASTQEKEDQHGLYNVLSTINVKKGHSSQPYHCSLWIPSLNKHLFSQELPLGCSVHQRDRGPVGHHA
ncbi:butyrophilin-like protein 2 [Embiotoca jacksoni]|uniref:butyrophilin-like protein 2 n=1 Tax=Embiotoca jacksoni TaxID=100190 RepID=UPI00370418EE